MADLNGGSELSQPQLNLTPEEKRVFGQLFQQADADNLGVVTGEVAVKFFERTKLAPSVLGEIWQIADTENRGLLTPAGFGIVLRLIGHYQAGRELTPDLAYKPGPLPRFDGLAGPPPASSTPTIPAGGIQPQSSGGPIRVPPLTPEKANEYASLFEKSGAQNGVLPGETAKQIFERARLPNEVLGRIWNLADTEQRGALGVTEFIVAMHLLASFKSGALRALPQILPSGLYEAASRRGPPPQRPQPTGMYAAPSPRPGDVHPMAAIPRQFSGASGRPQSPMSRSSFAAPPQSAQSTGTDWAIGPQDKAQFDSIFSTLDKANLGFITGDQAVAFFGNSKLPEEVLAQVWDLADINSEGKLNRDEFAVAMHLIRQQRMKRGVLPAALPPNLIPPSMRAQVRPPPAAPMPPQSAPSFDVPPPVQPPKSASEDLFGLDAFAPASPPPAQVPQSTGGSGTFAPRPFEGDPFGASSKPPITASPLSTHTNSPPAPTSVFKPFIPSSSFGQSMLSTQPTGGSNASAPSQTRSLQSPPPQPAVEDDLLGDNDPEVSKKLTQETTELANLSNQVGTLSKQMQELKTKRVSTGSELTQNTSQKRDFELRLSQLRGLYEQEVKDVKALEERLAASRSETRKLQQDIAMIEGLHQDLQGQHRQVVGALEADQAENARLKEQMRVVNAEISQLRPALDKLRSDARQQRGMVAINKKQLATNEGERDKVRTEMQDVSRAIEEDTRALQAASQTQSPQAVGSPAASTTSQSTNPFFRRSPPPTAENTMSPSPFARENVPQDQNTFENVFGPSFASPSAGPPPSTSFRSESQARDLAGPSVPSGQSVRSSEGPDLPTPSTSPPPSSARDSPRGADVPPPPESRQITSNFLPLRAHVPRADSFSSSVKVSAPASRYGGDQSGFDTPTNWVESITPTPSQEKDFTRGLERSDTNKTETGTVPPSTLDRNITASPTSSDAPRPSSSAPRESVPGAFPTDVTSPIQPMPTGESTLSERSKASSRPSEGFQSTRSDPFALSRDQRAPSAAKDDFDAAFAGFGPSRQIQERQHTGGSSVDGSTGASRFNQEFPPIEEFGQDDESDSNSEQGFDDNFAPASPQHVRKESADQSQSIHQPQASSRPATGAAEPVDDFFRSRPSVAHVESTSSLPTPGAQKSPPPYDQAVSPSTSTRRESNQFPPEFGGLLPSRQDPTHPAGSQSPEKTFSSPTMGGQSLFGGAGPSKGAQPTSTAPTSFPSSSPPLSNTPLSTAPSDAYQSAVSHPSVGKGPSPQSGAQAPQPQQPAKPSFDEFDDFADLADAKEVDDREPDEFGAASHSREGLDEFNPVFDTPVASKANTMASSQTATGNTLHGDDHFNDFEHNIGGGLQASGKAPQQPSATSEDWDAIFAGLNAPGGAGPSQPAAGAARDDDPFGSSSVSRPENGRGSGGEGELLPSTASPLPGLGRAISSGTEHDDPILKKLTSMGYPRDQALQALERYDYNIDKVSKGGWD
ncbi:hypothetical protein L228DRAFT_253800 [Xylona heveae TC161]|uniref:EF-hand n=1 Tax=Xylona heveae (strain CBS 132557 / TC161) TaxID=1328760 RepID=A0A165AJP4_XYLHT|nr:hypothetical protein L228DRAFT_253800 [Xylona heveae TC161]KZF20589.1 hypothetical protein L228DRAFT_253800 [Xylona heveae TC161]